MKIEVDETAGTLQISAPLSPPRPSKTGKTQVIFTTGGGLLTEATYKGKPVTVNLTVWFKP